MKEPFSQQLSLSYAPTLQPCLCFRSAFTLCKENLETLEAISYMAAALGVLPSDFTYAGVKDKRAITHQSMVVKKISRQR